MQKQFAKYMPKTAKHENCICHLPYKLYSVENSLILPDFVIPFSLLIRESKTIKENQFGSLETAHALHMDEKFCKSKG